MGTMSQTEDVVHHIVGRLLPHFADSRKKWPLWTDDRDTWKKLREPPVERYRWGRGFVAGSSCEVLATEAPSRTTVQLTAVWAAMAPAIPDRGDGLDIITPKAIANLPEPDTEVVEDLVERFRDALDFAWEQSHRLALSATGRRNQGLPVEPPRPAVCAEFCEMTGVLPAHPGGVRTALSEATLSRLATEATEIGEDVRKWELGEEDESLTQQWAELDPRTAEGLKRYPKRFQSRLARMRFPFLTPSEHEQLSRGEIRVWGLIAGRLPGDLTGNALERRLGRMR